MPAVRWIASLFPYETINFRRLARTHSMFSFPIIKLPIFACFTSDWLLDGPIIAKAIIRKKYVNNSFMLCFCLHIRFFDSLQFWPDGFSRLNSMVQSRVWENELLTFLFGWFHLIVNKRWQLKNLNNWSEWLNTQTRTNKITSSSLFTTGNKS